MATTDGKKLAPRVSKRGRVDEGRPTKFEPWMVHIGASLCALGATNDDLAEAFEVEPSTIDLWLACNQAFSGAVKGAKANADAAVERRLFERATGYEHDSEEIFCKDGDVTRVATRKRYAPDATSAIFWLKNRKPAEWREKQQLEITGNNGGPIQMDQTQDQVIGQLRALCQQNPMVKHKLRETLQAALSALE